MTIQPALLLLLAQAPMSPEEMKWSRFQGLEHPYSFMHYAGHPGVPPLAVYLFAFLITCLLATLIYVVQRAVQARLTLAGTRLLACAGLVLSFFLLLEASLGLFVHFFPYQMYIPDPVAFWRANPALALSTGHYDSHGVTVLDRPTFFDKEYTQEKTAGACRIICLGDSQTMGFPWVDATRDSYPKVLQALLREGSPQRRIEVVNGGISGYTSFQGLFALKHIALLYRPDALVVSYCYHDGNSSYTEDREVMSDDEREIATKRLLYRSQLYLLIRALIYRGKALGCDRSNKPVVRRVSMGDYEKNLRAMISLAKERGIRIFLVNLPIEDKDDFAGAYRAVMRRVAQSEGVPFIDGNAAFHLLPESERRLFFFDGVHFTVQGNRAVAAMLAREMAPVLFPARGAHPAGR